MGTYPLRFSRNATSPDDVQCSWEACSPAYHLFIRHVSVTSQQETWSRGFTSTIKNPFIERRSLLINHPDWVLCDRSTQYGEP